MQVASSTNQALKRHLLSIVSISSPGPLLSRLLVFLLAAPQSQHYWKRWVHTLAMSELSIFPQCTAINCLHDCRPLRHKTAIAVTGELDQY